MEPYHIKHQHQETANHSKQSFANCYWLLEIQTLNTYTTKPKFFQWIHISNFMLLKKLTQTQTHPLHDLNTYLNLPRSMKATIFHNNEHTNIIISKTDITTEECRENLKHIHTTITSQYLSFRKNKVTNTTPFDIHSSEQTLPCHMHTKLAQLGTNKSTLL